MKRRIAMVTAAGFLISVILIFSFDQTHYFKGDYFSQDTGDPDDILEQDTTTLLIDGAVDVNISAGSFIWQESDISVYLSDIRLTYSDVLIAVGSGRVLEGSITFGFSDGTTEAINLNVLNGTNQIKLNRVDGKITHFSADLSKSQYKLGSIELLENGKFTRLSANTFRAEESIHAVILDSSGVIVDEVFMKKKEMVTTCSGARYYREVIECRESD